MLRDEVDEYVGCMIERASGISATSEVGGSNGDSDSANELTTEREFEYKDVNERAFCVCMNGVEGGCNVSNECCITG